LAIGRAILSNPKLLLLDEPTEGIQPSIVDQIEDVIIGFKNSRRFAILLVEQGLHFAARLAEKYVVMAKGAVVVAGKSDELSADTVKKHLTYSRGSCRQSAQPSSHPARCRDPAAGGWAPRLAPPAVSSCPPPGGTKGEDGVVRMTSVLPERARSERARSMGAVEAP